MTSIYSGKMLSPHDGCIYWLALSENGPIKIGFSHSQVVERRMKQVLRNSGAESGFIMAIWRASAEDEARLHYHLRHQCIGHERYPLTDELVHLSKRPSHEVCQMLEQQYPEVRNAGVLMAEINQNARLKNVDYSLTDNIPVSRIRGTAVAVLRDAALMRGVKRFDTTDYQYLIDEGFTDAEAHTLHILLEEARFVPSDELFVRTAIPGSDPRVVKVRIAYIRAKIRDYDLPYIVNSYYGRGYTAETIEAGEIAA